MWDTTMLTQNDDKYKNDDKYDQGYYNKYEDQNEYNPYGEVSELCSNLYQVSARCDKHYRAYNTKTNSAKYAEAVAQEDLSCQFIDSIVMGNYKDGFANIEVPEDGHSSVAKQTNINGLQIFGLSFSILATTLLSAWAYTLRKSVKKAWKPRVSHSMRSSAKLV